jgi:hypothetical protein
LEDIKHPFRNRNRDLVLIHHDEHPIVLKAQALMAEYIFFKHPLPDIIQILQWIRKAWSESEDDLKTHIIMSSESFEYVHCYHPRSQTLNANKHLLKQKHGSTYSQCLSHIKYQILRIYELTALPEDDRKIQV